MPELAPFLRNWGTPKIPPTGWITTYSATEPDVGSERIEAGHGIGWIAVGHGSIWLTSAASRTVALIDARSLRLTSMIDLGKPPVAIVIGSQAAWVLGSNGWLWRLWPDGNAEGVARLDGRARSLAHEGDSVWALSWDGDLTQIDESTGETVLSTKVGRGSRQLLSFDGALLVAYDGGRKLRRLRPESGVTEAEGKLPDRAIRCVVHGRTLWAACARKLNGRWGALRRIDPLSLTVAETIILPTAPRALTAGADHLWVAHGRRGSRACSIARVDPRSGELTPWASSDWPINDLAVAGDALLAATSLRLGNASLGGEGGFGGGGGGDCGGGGGDGGGGNC